MKIIIATKNPGKIEGARKAFSNYFADIEIEGIPASSDVGDQPVDLEIYHGAKNRVRNLKKHCQQQGIEADLFISIESGITNQLGKWIITNVAIIEDNNDFESFGTSSGFPVPEKYVQEIINSEFSTVMDRVFNEDDLRSGKGGVSLLTKGVVTRGDLTETAFIMALTSYINGNIWCDTPNDRPLQLLR